LFLGVGFVTLAYAGGMATWTEIYQRYQSRMFEQRLDVREFIYPNATITAVDRPEGDLVGKMEIPRIGISVMVLF